MSNTSENFNPEYNPNGAEGSLDTNKLPWIPLDNVEGLSIKPVRASSESGMFSLIFKLDKGSCFPSSVYLGGMDLLVLSGQLTYNQDDQESVLAPGTWGFIPANSKVNSINANEDCEVLANFYNAVAFLDDNQAIKSILTSNDILQLAKKSKIPLVP